MRWSGCFEDHPGRRQPANAPLISFLGHDAKIIVGVATLSDQRERPIFPRWFGFFNLWVAVLFLPVSLLTFFKTGPFAWSGVFGWYLGLIAFGTWYFVAFYVLQQAIRERDREALA